MEAPEPAVLAPGAPETLAHKLQRLPDDALDAAWARAMVGDFEALDVQLARLPPPCVLHPPGPRKHRKAGTIITRRGAGVRAAKVSPWGR